MAQQEPRNGVVGACPSVDSLLQWQQGQLSSEQIHDMIHHLDTCALCLNTLEGLTSADPISRHLRQEPPALSDEEKDEVATLVLRHRGLMAVHDASDAQTQLKPCAPCVTSFHFLSRPETAKEIGRLGMYRILRVIGHGGMGLVFEAEDLHLQRSVALKVIRPDTAQKPGTRARFLREARAAAAVRHENVVTIYQVSEANDVPFLVMELLQGQSLESRCKQGPPLSLSEIVRIGREAAAGLAAAHDKGLIHRDVKPDNIWLEEPREKVKVLDFGLARVGEFDSQISRDGLIVGTPAYMAPEQARGGPVDARSDLFSLGCVLYRLASGRLPFQGNNTLAILQALANEVPPPLRQLNPAVPESFSRLVASLLARRPEDRPASAQAVVLALARVDEKETKKQRGQSSLRTWLSSRLPVSSAVAGMLVASLAFGGAVAVVSVATVYRPETRPREPEQGSFEKTENKRTASPAMAPADYLKREDIPADLLARAGGGDPRKAPTELVAVLGGARYFPTQRPFQEYCFTRFSPDGRFLAACANKEVWVYEAATGQVLWRLAHEKSCGWFDFRLDSNALAVNCQDGIALWDLQTGKSLGRLTEHAHLMRGISFTPDGRSLVTTDADGKARLWDIDGENLARTFEPPEGHRYTQAPQIHLDGRLVALHASGPSPVVRVLDLATGETKATVPGAGPVPGATGLALPATVRFSPDGRLLASVRGNQAILLWDVATWKEVGVLDGGASIVNFSADSGTLFRGRYWNGDRTTVILDDVKARGRKTTLSLPIAGELAWSDLSPDGRTVAVRNSMSNCVRLFDAVTGQERFSVPGHWNMISTLAVSPDGRLLASTGHDHRVLLWNLQTGQVVRELAFVPAAYRVMYGAAFNSDGKWVAAAMQETNSPGWIRVWETATGKEVVTLPGKGRDWQRAEFAFHPNGRSLITAERTRLKIWRLPDGSSTTWEEGHDKPIETLAFHPDGRQVAAGDKGGGVCLWDASLFKRLRQFRCEGAVVSVRFSPDGEMLAATTAAPDAALYLWNLQTGATTRRVVHTDTVVGLAWRPDSQALATASMDRTIRLWPRDPDKEPRTLRLHAGMQRHLAFTPDGRHLVTGNEDGSIFVLRLAPSP